jgi:GT2 family glycosyltransferase
MDWREWALAAVLRSVDTLAPLLPLPETPAPTPLPAARPGFSILIPERGTPALLAGCLASVKVACAATVEPVAIHVVVNGCARGDYAALCAQHPAVDWHFEAQALGFSGALARGLDVVAHDWVYLVNSDMTLAPDALAHALPLRDARTFAIASQIFFADPTRRREETGWTDYRVDQHLTQHYDRMPEGMAVRGHLYAGGGASLFRTALLRRYSAATAAYAPFYFEDADWGVQAARAGYAVKFCPASMVWHVHRATIGQHYAPAEITRIVRRNQLLFEARHGFGGRARMLGDEPASTRRELTAVATLAGMLSQRWRTCRARTRGYAPERSCATFYPRPFRAERPVVLFSAPSALQDVAAGRAHDLLSTAQQLARDTNVVLITTEIPVIAMSVEASFAPFAAVHVIAGGKPDPLTHAADATRPAPVSRERQLAWWRSVYRGKALSVKYWAPAAA